MLTIVGGEAALAAIVLDYSARMFTDTRGSLFQVVRDGMVLKTTAARLVGPLREPLGRSEERAIRITAAETEVLGELGRYWAPQALTAVMESLHVSSGRAKQIKTFCARWATAWPPKEVSAPESSIAPLPRRVTKPNTAAPIAAIRAPKGGGA